MYILSYPSIFPLSFTFSYLRALYVSAFLSIYFSFLLLHSFYTSYLCHTIIMQLSHTLNTSCIALRIIPMRATLFMTNTIYLRLFTVSYYTYRRNCQKFKVTANSVTGETYLFSGEIYSLTVSIESEHHFCFK